MARGLNLESARVRPAPADAPSRAGTCLAGTCLARPRRAHSRPPAPLPGLPPSRRAGPPPGHRGAPSPTPPRAPDARPAARAQQCPHLGTPATFRTASGNEIKSLGRGGGVPPNNRGGWHGRCCGDTGCGGRSPHQGPPAACPDRWREAVRPPAVSSPTGSPGSQAGRGGAGSWARAAALRPQRPRGADPRVRPPARQASSSSQGVGRGRPGRAAGTPRPPALRPLTGGR